VLTICREKLLKYDIKRREYDIIVIGEEPHLAYNRVGLTSFFQHRQVENLYLNPKEWVSVKSSASWRKLNLLVLCDARRLAQLPSQHTCD
jgi:nitrite reductase (NAD(P)H)